MLGAAVAGVVGALAALAAPAGARVGFDVAVIDSNAVAASVGIISRVPAESPGGLNWTATAITLDKAVAKAAGGTGGSLAETFLESSSKEYRNPSLIGAQYPPTATIPTEARGGSPAGTPGGIVATHVVATEQPAATAEAQGGRGGDGGPVVVQGGSSSSHGELRADGAVLTRATSMASGVAIGGGAVTFSSATTEAVTTVPPAGPPTTALKVTVTGLLVGGVPAELTDRGLGISDEVPVGAAQLAAFNAAVGQLAARGITITAAPTVREIGAGQARAEGGGMVVRYKVADQIGGDEEVVLAEARSSSTLQRAQPASPLPLPALPSVSEPPASAPAASAAAPQSAAPTRAAAPPAGSEEEGIGPGAGNGAGPSNGAEAVGPAGPASAAGPLAAAASASPRPALNLLGREDDRAPRKLRTGYGVVLLLAFAGTALHFAAQRARTT
ncbi:MAG TPA: hypothetical protein VFE55_05155 [Acidimicrobiia bacterium]|nr:hypothetical protein [Acidimicrobiia bacterium]